jgi:hypothetical protein
MWRKAQVEHALGSHNPFVLNDLIPENIRNEIISPFVRLLHTDILEHQSDDNILWTRMIHAFFVSACQENLHLPRLF